MKMSYVLNPLFALALATLLLNDFLLKGVFSNALTGKLSDLAGIIVIALFLTAFLPGRKTAVYLFAAVAFVFWKSPLSDSLITFLNTHFSAGYVRVVDYTDLACLLILVPLYRFEPKTEKNRKFLKPLFLPVCCLTLFAIAATSRAQPEQYGYVYVGKEITFESSKDNFLNLLTAHNIEYKMIYKYTHQGDSLENYELKKFLIGSDTIYGAVFSIKQPKPNGIVLTLHNIHFTEQGAPVERVNYANQDSIVETYRLRAINYFESFRQK